MFQFKQTGDWKNRKYSFFTIAVILFWLKTYIAYKIEFNLGIDNGLQKFLLLINPISSALLFFGFALLFRKKVQFTVMLITNFVLSFLLYANIVYYRFFNDFITVPVLMQTKTNAGQLGDSALSLMSFMDVFYFTDTILLAVLAVKAYGKFKETGKRSFRLAMLFAVTTFLFNLGLAEKDRPQLLTRSFDRVYLVKYLGAYNFTIYDAVQNIKSSSQRALADSSDITEIENYRNANYNEPNPKYFGKAKGMNVIYISLESLQSFIIDYKLDGQEVTPFLNSLTRDPNTFYFKNVFHQTSQGKTSDAEFLMENSLYPMSQGAVFINKAQNTFHATPAILKGYGYNSAVFHGNYKTFWNRNVMYKALGYDRFFDAEYYTMKEEDTKNYGMKDKPFFKESIPLLKTLKQPFYTKFITLSNHFPFEMDEEDTDFPAGTTGNDVVDHYFQSANYMDQAIEQFFNDLKAAGLYDNTMVVMYGDHYGISENHNAAMSQVVGEEITPFKNAQLQRVPLFIHVPGVKAVQDDSFGGQIDVRPTMLHLLGIDTKDFLEFGSDLLSPQHHQVVSFRNGDFVSPKLTQVNEKCYDTTTGELVEDGTMCAENAERVKTELQMSDEIVLKDLLRFYTPNGYKPINPNDYEYIKEDVPVEDTQE
ncbi:glycerol phosphate lipoteichoic acid synthase [Neobacillus piezotolerans]|uniref:Glycerol phosphate lipoteichoic acid synthase n=1 Tax=Neobacillus piezotolerans TaxID=2259171 RepID=A0A3D8GMY9_9BACI|nr:LTA synthase family protein [Neobacillus piezotolerans]RDU35778.1 glycerol phosphate lipoteichoic acid synthase [Neobacillus piezotolerans]